MHKFIIMIALMADRNDALYGFACMCSFFGVVKKRKLLCCLLNQVSQLQIHSQSPLWYWDKPS